MAEVLDNLLVFTGLKATTGRANSVKETPYQEHITQAQFPSGSGREGAALHMNPTAWISVEQELQHCSDATEVVVLLGSSKSQQAWRDLYPKGTGWMYKLSPSASRTP